ncbi:hypothetical protein AB0K15_46925 [Amycolatopsis sp. NPDC049253]|uniref:hypothetical protein n=1 Tax=Amycolatopsis sp. NPDC049253 TaxID=3155274 RepID=UPI00341A66D7
MALGVTAGYLLGRTKKMRLALMIAAAGATGRAGVSPTKLVQSGLKQLSSSAEVGQLTSLAKDELLSAAKSAAVTAASGRIESLSERLQDGGSLRAGKKSGKADDEDTDVEPQEEPEMETEEPGEDDEAEEEPRRRRSSSPRANDDNEDDGRLPRRRAPSQRSNASDEQRSDDGGEKSTSSPRTATRRAPVRRAGR